MTGEIGDPLERARQGKIGARRSEPNPGGPAVQPTTSQCERSAPVAEMKPLPHRGRKQHTIYLEPPISKRVKIEAAERECEVSEIIGEALVEYWAARDLHRISNGDTETVGRVER